MSKGTIVTSAFRVHRSKFSCSLAAALLDGLFEHPAGVCPCGAARLSSSQAHMRTIDVLACQNNFPQPVTGRISYVSTTLARCGEGVHHTLCAKRLRPVCRQTDLLAISLFVKLYRRSSFDHSFSYHCFKRIAQSPQTRPPSTEGIPQWLQSHYRYAVAG